MSQNHYHDQNEIQSQGIYISRGMSFPKPVSSDGITRTAVPFFKTSVPRPHRGLSSAPGVENFAAYNEPSLREELMAKRVPQSNGIEDEFSPHTALPPPPRSLRRVLSASAQPQSPSQYLPPGNGETLAFMESFPAPVSGLQPVTQESISLPVQSDTLPDALASKGSIKHSSYEDFAKTVTLAEMEIMGPASHYVQERRKSSHVSEVPPPRPAARHGQQIMSFAEIQAALVKLERNGSGGAETGVSPRLHARSSASRNAQSPIKTHGSLVLNTPSSTPNMRPQARGVLPSSSLSHEIRLPVLRDPPPEPIQWRNPFANPVGFKPPSHVSESEFTSEGAHWDTSTKSSSGQSHAQAHAPHVAPAVHYSLDGNPGLTRVLTKDKREWPDYTRGWNVEGPPGSSPPIARIPSRVASFSDLRTQPQEKSRSQLRRTTSTGGNRSMFCWFRCCAEPDLSTYVVDSPPARRGSLTPSARVSVQLTQAWRDIELPERNKGRATQRT